MAQRPSRTFHAANVARRLCFAELSEKTVLEAVAVTFEVLNRLRCSVANMLPTTRRRPALERKNHSKAMRGDPLRVEVWDDTVYKTFSGVFAFIFNERKQQGPRVSAFFFIIEWYFFLFFFVHLKKGSHHGERRGLAGGKNFRSRRRRSRENAAAASAVTVWPSLIRLAPLSKKRFR